MFYDKRKHMKETHGIDINDNLLRIEYRLCNSDQIKARLGSHLVNQLTDEKIKSFLQDRFHRDFVEPFNKLKDDNRKLMKKLVKKWREKKTWMREAVKYFWGVECQRKKPVLIDVTDFLTIVKAFDVHNNFSRDKKRILDEFPKAYSNQYEKYEELFKKVIDL
jgi:hypothetical protein